MFIALPAATLLKALLLGWSVAWPPGPINAEMIRRGLLAKKEGGGFWNAWKLGLGACTGDFIWALSVSAGAGAIINTARVRLVLGVISLLLLLLLAAIYTRGAWRAAFGNSTDKGIVTVGLEKKRLRLPAFWLGLIVVLTSPWNIGFWLAVIGSQSGPLSGSLLGSIFFAAAVVCGAAIWGLALSLAVKLGARIFSRPGWQIATQALTALVMIYFAIQLAVRLVG